MKKDEIFLSDVGRILFGQAPPMFLLEVLLRTMIIYLGAVAVLRVLSKRMSGQLTIAELGIMVLLGAVIAPPAQTPDRGIILGLTILTSVILLHHGFTKLDFKAPKVEELAHGQVSLLVKDGVLQLKEIKAANVPPQQLYTELRNKKIYNLGQVKRVYMEAYGLFSVYKEEQEEKPGLPLFHKEDRAILEGAKKSPDGAMACQNCGNVARDVHDGVPCGVCEATEWTRAIV